MRYSDLFRYEDGKLFWKIKRRGLIHTREVGTINKGYKWVKSHLLPKQVGVHRVIWEMHNGPIPTGMVIDHIDRNSLNNKIENLRLATKSANSMNAKGKSGKRSGLPKNVYKDYEYNGVIKYRAQILADGKRVRIGGFSDIKSAEVAAQELVKKYHGEFAYLEQKNAE